MPDYLGYFEPNTLQIWVKQRLRKSKAQEILLHEVLHVASSGLVKNGKDQYDEESFVSALAPVVLSTLQDNPGLVEYLTR